MNEPSSTDRFFPDFTPLIGDADVLRVARYYPGGDNLDTLFGEKPIPEAGWYYPEAWLFSPVPAINPGSRRTDEGETVVYDRDLAPIAWKRYVELNRERLLGPHALRLIVKLLDGSVTLPKEFHFRSEDETRLQKYPKFREFEGTFIKPEAWIRHPAAEDTASDSFFGFHRRTGAAEIESLIDTGVEALEGIMNRTLIQPGTALYLPGGIVHSLGSGLYFEVLADGDLRITLQDKFAGRSLSASERLGVLHTGAGDDYRRALDFIDFDIYGQGVFDMCRCVPEMMDENRTRIVQNPWFGADWITLAPGDEYIVDNCRDRRPCILVGVQGSVVLGSDDQSLTLAPGAGGVSAFERDESCYGAVVHFSTSSFALNNSGECDSTLIYVTEGESAS